MSDKSTSDAKATNNLTDYWVPLGTSVKIADVVIEGGLLYFGSGLCSIGSPSKAEPALIDPKLPVGKLESVNYQQEYTFNGQGSANKGYSGCSPNTRAAYIKWLMNGRNDPLVDINFILLYFYGLERRALVDVKTDATAKSELPIIIKEIERLLDIYHSNYSAFRRFLGYATDLLNFLKLDYSETLAPKLYLASPPDLKPQQHFSSPPNLESQDWSFLQLVIGQLTIDKKPIPADWAYAWLLADPQIWLNTPAIRCAIEFKQLFITKYRESFGSGIRVLVNSTHFKSSYHTASRSFYSEPYSDSSRTIKKPSNFPDQNSLESFTKELISLSKQCSKTLDAYSRFLGRNPELAGTFDALLELPYSLWTEQQKCNIQTIKKTLETNKVPFEVELNAWFPEWKNITKSSVAAFIDRLTEAGLGMEPDPRFIGQIPCSETKVVVFIDDGKWVTPNPLYINAALMIHLSVIVSLIDGEVGKEVKDLLMQQIESWLHLEPFEKNRLHAYLLWLLSERPDFKKIKKQVEAIPVPVRDALVDFLIIVSSSDNNISPNKIKLLETIFRTLNLDVHSLYRKLHVTSADELVTVRLPLPISTGFAIPDPPERNTGFQLDMNRVLELKKESKKVTDMLVAIFDQDVNTEIAMPIQIDNDNLLGLDSVHSNLIKFICTRIQWTRNELEKIAADSGLMLDGALEHINEASYDTYDAPLTEGDDPININQEILKELLK